MVCILLKGTPTVCSTENFLLHIVVDLFGTEYMQILNTYLLNEISNILKTVTDRRFLIELAEGSDITSECAKFGEVCLKNKKVMTKKPGMIRNFRQSSRTNFVRSFR